MEAPRFLVLFTSALLTGCAGPDAGNADVVGELVLYMTSATHSGGYGIHLAPWPGTAPETPPASCEVDPGNDEPEGLACAVSSGTPVDYACGESEPERAPWSLDVHWRGFSEWDGWTVTARDSAGQAMARWAGEQLECQGHLTE